MSVADGIAVAAVFVWIGMVLAISFMEAPLKFRAPGVTLAIGLGIGRIVFRGLNSAEILLAVAFITAAAIAGAQARVVIAGASCALLLAVQLGAVRPLLTRRSDRILAGEDAPRSRSHYVYIALEVVKLAGLVTAAALLLSSV